MASRKKPPIKRESQDVMRKTRRDFLKTAGAVTGGITLSRSLWASSAFAFGAGAAPDALPYKAFSPMV